MITIKEVTYKNYGKCLTSYGQDGGGETAEYTISSRSNDSAPYAYSKLDTFRYQDGKLCSISIKVNWGEGTA